MKVAVIGSASGSGKTTLARELARRLDVPFVELDALVHGPNWPETPNDVLRTQLEPIVAGASWVLDGVYRGKLGDYVLDETEVFEVLGGEMAFLGQKLPHRRGREVVVLDGFRHRLHLLKVIRVHVPEVAVFGRLQLLRADEAHHLGGRREG